MLPTMTLQSDKFLACIENCISAYFGIVSGISSDILSTDMISNIISGISSDNLAGISSGTLSGISFDIFPQIAAGSSRGLVLRVLLPC